MINDIIKSVYKNTKNGCQGLLSMAIISIKILKDIIQGPISAIINFLLCFKVFSID